jgi:hypothetical protein
VKQSARTLAIGLSISALLSVVALVFIRQAFSIGAGVVAVITATVLLSVYLSVRGVIRVDPSSALRQG